MLHHSSHGAGERADSVFLTGLGCQWSEAQGCSGGRLSPLNKNPNAERQCSERQCVMKRRLFWGFLVAVNGFVVLFLAVDPFVCGGASPWGVFLRFRAG